MPSSPSAPRVALGAQSATARLDALRGPVPPRSHDARTIAALTVNPGCSRRAVLDAAGVDKRKLAERIGFPARYGQSPFAITRGLAFEKQVKAEGCVALIELLRSELGFEVPEHEYVDLGVEPKPGAGQSAGTGTGLSVDRGTRYERTRAVFGRVAAGEALLADHPLLRLDVGGRTAFVEPDVVALSARPAGAGASAPARLYVAEVKSFSVIDGQADPEKVGAAAVQSAVYVLALRRLFTELGVDPALVAEDVILVCPKDFANQPSAHLLDVRRQLAAVQRQLDRLPRIAALIADLDSTVDFDLAVDPPAAQGEPGREHRSAGELTKSLTMVEARYAPECVTRCEMAFHCRAEARSADATDVLGRSVRDALGGLASIEEVLALADAPADGAVAASDLGRGGGGGGGGPEAARLLRAAARAYDEALMVAPRRAEGVVETVVGPRRAEAVVGGDGGGVSVARSGAEAVVSGDGEAVVGGDNAAAGVGPRRAEGVAETGVGPRRAEAVVGGDGEAVVGGDDGVLAGGGRGSEVVARASARGHVEGQGLGGVGEGAG